MSATQTEVARATRARILDAAFDAACDFGLSRMTMEDCAARAGCSRQTLYRYFPAKDDLVAALILREEERFLDGVRAAFPPHDETRRAIEEAVAFVFHQARRHPLLDRLLSTEAEILLPYLTIRSGPVLARAREVLAGLLAARLPAAPRVELERTADAAVRLLVSYVIAPPQAPPGDVAGFLADTLEAALERPRPSRRKR